MKLIKERYNKLVPSINLLGDEVVMAQAWKKTHAYMRLHNWYADTLALDISALGLESLANKWAGQFNTDKAIKPEPMELVPAPKSEPWTIDEKLGWVPQRKRSTKDFKLPIRPLAHLTVRDQTLASAAMLCLADVIETTQGRCSRKCDADYFKHMKQGVSNYGNRLVCDWNGNEARFRWGSADTYRKFFTDYQSFLRRPIVVGRSVAGNQSIAEGVYIVSLDISRFYDCIDRKILVERLRSYYPGSSTDDEDSFWSRLAQIIDWQWSKDSLKTASEIGVDLGNGLPQGLVSAGFFANAYLLKFDNHMTDQIRNSSANRRNYSVHDYCRYVDDLRLVISVDGDVELSDIEKQIEDWISETLSAQAGSNVKLNRSKSMITALNDLDNRGVFSERVAQIQNQISGPADRESLESIQGVLEGFLTADVNPLAATQSNNPDFELIKITSFDHDIRPDTLKRFAANRLERVIRSKRRFDIGATGDNVLKHTIDNESELVARKLVWAWLHDPSLGLVLRKAFEIFPSPDIAEPVLEALYVRSSFGMESKNSDIVSAAMANYILSDIFRSGVEFQGDLQKYVYPDTANPNGLLELICQYAQKVMSKSNVPKYVSRQALLFLAVMSKPVRMSSTDNSIHHSLHAILAGMEIDLVRQRLALFEVAAQITGNPNTVAAQLIDSMEELGEAVREEIVEEYAKRGGQFWEVLWRRLRRNDSYKAMVTKYYWASPPIRNTPSSTRQFLSKVIASNSNGFVHEAGFLKLALGLLQLLESTETSVRSRLCPRTVKVKQVVQYGRPISWADVWKPIVTEIICTSDNRHVDEDPRFSIPNWIRDEHDAKIIYKFGAILRGAVVGSTDFTDSRWKRSNTTGYKGLRTGWFKRRMGMAYSPEALVGDYATLSSWVSELLMTCLQWPGFEASWIDTENIADISSVAELRSTLVSRLEYVNGLYCTASEMPALVTSVKRPESSDARGFRVVTVQHLLPRTSDFSSVDPELNAPIHRGRLRDHISRTCSITYKTLIATAASQKDNSISSADLIVFPEVGVHPEDLDVVKRLADKTGAIILAGVVFTNLDGIKVNLARWIIPDYRDSGRQWIIRDQGKKYPTEIEKSIGISGYRPCQHLIEINGFEEGPFYLSGSICYDATDLKLASDLKDKTDLFIILAHNMRIPVIVNTYSGRT